MAYETSVGNRGSVVVHNRGLKFTVVIPSRKRHKIAADHPLLPLANVLVADSEIDTYKAYFENNGVPYGAVLSEEPARGLTFVRNNALDWFFEEDHDFQFQTDDDTVAMWYIGGRVAYKVESTQGAIDIVCHVAQAAKDAGTGAFGFHQTGRPMERSMLQPFRLRGWAKCQGMGILDRDLRFDPGIRDHEDVDMCLQVMARYGFFWRDERWAVMPQGGNNGTLAGGLAGARTSLRIAEDHQRIIDKWGEQYFSGRQTRGAATGLTMRIPQ